MGIKSTDGTLVEAEIVINGRALDFGSAMTLRVAVGSFLMYCTNSKESDLGEIGPLYAERCKEILNRIHYDTQATRDGVPALKDDELDTQKEINRLENVLRYIAQNYASDDTNLQDDISRALRGKSVP